MIVHWGCYRRCKKVCTESWLWEKNPLSHRGINPVSVLHLAFQSDAVLTEPYRPCKVFFLFLFFKVWQQLTLVCCWQIELGHWRNIYTHTSLGEETTDMWFMCSVGAFDLADQVWWAWCFEMQGLWIYIYSSCFKLKSMKGLISLCQSIILFQWLVCVVKHADLYILSVEVELHCKFIRWYVLHGFAGKEEGGFQPFCLLKMKLSYNWTCLIMFVKTVHVMVCLKGV